MAQLLSKMQLTAAPTADGSGVTVHVPITRSDVLHGEERQRPRPWPRLGSRLPLAAAAAACSTPRVMK